MNKLIKSLLIGISILFLGASVAFAQVSSSTNSTSTNYTSTSTSVTNNNTNTNGNTNGSTMNNTTNNTNGTVNYGGTNNNMNASLGITTLSRQLSFGSRGSDVRMLQQFLAEDTSIYPEGLVTGYYGRLTRSAVVRFQIRYGIAAVGRVGPITLAQINTLISSGASLGAGTTAPTISNVSINVTSSSTPSAVTITWTTDSNAQGKVFYSTTPMTLTEGLMPGISGNVVMANNNNFSTSQSVTISNLTSATTYYYAIEAIDQNGNVSLTWPAIFRTNP